MSTRFDLDLDIITAWLDEQAAMGAPEDLFGQVMERASHSRRRPAWATLERWIPMETRAQFGAVPKTAIALATIALFLLVGIAAAFAASHSPTRVNDVRNGLVAYASDGDIYVQNEDGTDAHAIITGLSVDLAPTFSRDGTRLAYWSSGTVVVSGADGSNPVTVSGSTVLATPSGESGHGVVISWSPDGRRLVFDGVGSLNLYIAAADGSSTSEIDVGSLKANTPQWSPDGAWIAFRGTDTVDATKSGVYVIRPDGTDLRQIGVTWNDNSALTPPAWSPDSRRIAYDFFQNQSETGGAPCPDFDYFDAACSRKDIAIATVDGSAAPTILGDFMEDNSPSFSPDGTRLAYTYSAYPSMDATGVFTGLLYVANADGTNAHAVDGTAVWNGLNGQWSPDGTKILAAGIHPSDSLMVLTVEGSSPAVITPVVRGNDMLPPGSWQSVTSR